MTPSEWNRFTEHFTKESDPEKLRSLMDEMNRALALSDHLKSGHT